MTRTWLLILVFCCLSMGCRTSASVLVAEELGESGWYELEGPYKAKSLFRRSKSESERLDVAGAPCDELIQEREDKHQVFVLVPGILGAGKEWEPVIERLARPGRSLFFFRWVPLDNLDTLSRGLGAGLRSLASCLDGDEDALIVLAHSAGGIIAAQAASRVSIRAGAPTVRVFTAASALAGIQVRKEAGEDDAASESEEEEGEGEEEAQASSPEAEVKAENRFFLMAMGGAFRDYAPVGKGVEVFHLRTQAPADPVMKPRRGGKLPNDPRVGVPGAYQVSLPSELGHDQSLLYATERLEDGGWVKWRSAPRVPIAAQAP